MKTKPKKQLKKNIATDKPHQESIKIIWIWAVILTVLLLTVVIRLRMLNIPLDRDEGGYAYAGQLLLQGILPVIYDVQMPGLYGVYAIILAIFGHSTAGIHLGLLVANMATTVLMFFLGRHLIDTTTGLVACTAFATMSISQQVAGFSANAEPFLILAVTGGLLLILRAIQFRNLVTIFFGGFTLGLAFLIKQHGIFFIAFGGAFFLIKSFSQKQKVPISQFLKEYTLFIAGVLIPFGTMCLCFASFGVFDKFWYWIFEHGFVYSSAIPFSYGMSNFISMISNVSAPAIGFWLLAGFGLLSFLWSKTTGEVKLFAIMFLLFSFLSIIPGYRFYDHYWLLLLPSLSLLSGIGVCSFASLLPNKPLILRTTVVSVLLISVMMYFLIAERAYLFHYSPEQISWNKYGLNAFPTSPRIAGYIKERASSEDFIAVLGSEPQITFLTGLKSASAYIWVYGLTEEHEHAKEMQKEMIREIETVKPRFIVYVNIPTSWLRKQNSYRDIFDWLTRYVPKHYKRIGLVDIPASNSPIFVWEENALNYRPRSRYRIEIFERKF